MDLVVPTPTRVQWLRYIFGSITSMKIGLYQQPWTPTPADTTGTYQAIEADFSVYQRIPFSIVSYNFDAQGIAVAFGTFTSWHVTFVGPPNLIYGYFVVDNSNNLLWAQSDPNGPQRMRFVGDRYRVMPQVALGALR